MTKNNENDQSQQRVNDSDSSTYESVNNTVAEEKNTPPKIKGLGVALTTSVVLGGICMNFLGQVSHTSYLHAWGVDSGLFPKSLNWYSVNGYYALSDRTVNFASSLLSDGAVIALISAAILSLILYIRLLKFISKKANARNPSKAFKELPRWLQRLFQDIVITTLSTALIPMLLLTLGIFLAIPSFVGESRGKAHAAKERIEFSSKGCGNTNLSTRCFELKRNQEAVGKGYLIDSSQTHIAFYDINLMKARTIEREGLEMEAE